MEDPNAVAGLVGLGGAAIVAALVEVVKRLLCLEDTNWTRVLPLTAILLGLAWNVLIGPVVVPDMSWRVVVIYGLFSGLGAIGLYGGSKTTTGR